MTDLQKKKFLIRVEFRELPELRDLKITGLEKGTAGCNVLPPSLDIYYDSESPIQIKSQTFED